MYDLPGIVLAAVSSENWWVDIVTLVRWPVAAVGMVILLALIFRKPIRALLGRIRRVGRGKSEILFEAEAALEAMATTTAAPTTTTGATAAEKDDGVVWGHDERRVSKLVCHDIYMPLPMRGLLAFLGLFGPLPKDDIFKGADELEWDQQCIESLETAGLVEVQGDSVGLSELGRDFVRLLGR